MYIINKNECPVNSFNIEYIIPLYFIKYNTPCTIADKAHINGVYILISLAIIMVEHHSNLDRAMVHHHPALLLILI